jgi:anaerobic magnesium-protoporphyrin IX monomethyl ester cyclase
MMMISVLEHPRVLSAKRFNDIANTPLWSCVMGGYAAAALKHAGHEVHFLDATTRNWGFSRVEREILGQSSALLAINAVYFWEHTPLLFDFLSRLRSAGFAGHINLFGFFPTLAHKAILSETPEVDSIAVGECEHTLVELAGRLSKSRDWRDVPGLAYYASGKVSKAAPRIPERNPEVFVFPLRDQESRDTASILASRGCYNHCSFCPIPSFYGEGPLWRGRSPENVLEEMAELRDQGWRDFYFVDPNFIGPGQKGRDRIRHLAKLIGPLGITFGMETRPNDLDAGILDCLGQAGLQSLLLGIESGSASVLGRLHKSASGNVSERAIALCRSAGIEPEVGFLMFVPDSTVEDLERNLDFLRRNNLLDRLDRTANLLCHCQIVLLGTTDYLHFKEQGRLRTTGAFGFEGEVSFRDERVRWTSELAVHACLLVLQEMSRPESPVFWGRPEAGKRSQGVNDYLVNLFEQLLNEARKMTALTPPGALKSDIETELLDRITRVETGNDAESDGSVSDLPLRRIGSS